MDLVTQSDLAFEVVDWIFDADEVSALFAVRDQLICDASAGRMPLVARDDCNQQLLAGSVIRLLPCGTARLIGFRARPELERLLHAQIDDGCSAIEALEIGVLHFLLRSDSQLPRVNETSIVGQQRRLLTQMRFEPLTEIQQLWLDCEAVAEFDGDEPDLVWQSAERFGEERFWQLLKETFVDSQDFFKPGGNDRSNEQPPRSLIELNRADASAIGHEALRCVLLHRGEPAGCLILRCASATVMEIVYLGLVPACRQQGLSGDLIRRAIRIGRQRCASFLTTAVDSRNLPALRLYGQFPFHTHAHWELWQREVASC